MIHVHAYAMTVYNVCTTCQGLQFSEKDVNLTVAFHSQNLHHAM